MKWLEIPQTQYLRRRTKLEKWHCLTLRLTISYSDQNKIVLPRKEVDQWNQNRELRNRHEYNQLQWSKDIFPTNGAATAGHSHGGKKTQSEHRFYIFKKIKSIGLYYLNIKHKTIKLLENHLGENLDDIRDDDDFVRYIINIIHERNML